MKVLLRIFVPLCVVSFIAFGISVGVLGTDQGAVSESQYNDAFYELDDYYTHIDADIGAYYLEIQPHSVSTTEVYISGRNADKIHVEVRNNSTLKVWTDGTKFSFGSWKDWLSGLGDYPHVLLKIPDMCYQKLDIAVSSGSASVNGIEAIDVALSTSSGEINYVQPQGYTTDSLYVSTTSGDITAKNAATKSYNIRSTSGDIDIDGLTGTGSIKATSGDLNIGFSEFSQYCDVNVTSGDVTLVVPDNTNANINCKKTSGDIVISACGVYRDVGEKETVLLGRGGVTMDVRATSGNVVITDSPTGSTEAAHTEITSAYGIDNIAKEIGSEVSAAFDEAHSEVSAAFSQADITDAFDF